MGLFDRDTDMSDGEPSTDDPQFEPVEGTGPGDENEDDDSGTAGSPSRASKLVPVRFRDDDFNGTLERAVDGEAGVVPDAYGNGNAGGLAAVPLADTGLVWDE